MVAGVIEKLKEVGLGVGAENWTAARDRASISSSEQVLGEMANFVEFIMAPEETPCFPVEFERVDDGESSKIQDVELECENGDKT